MTHRERVFAAVRGKPLDRLPFGARIDHWYNYHSAHHSLPEEYQGKSMLDINRDLGVGTLFRLLRVWRKEYRMVSAKVIKEPPYITYEYETPHGKLGQRLHFDEHEGSISPYIVEHLFKSPEDYGALEYLIQHEDLLPDLQEFNATRDLAGDDGTIAVGDAAGPMQIIMKQIMGYEQFIYQMFDNPKRVRRLCQVLTDQWWEKLRIIVESGVSFPVVCGNWSDDIHTPYFREHLLPWIQQSTSFLHSHGALSMIHVDGEIRQLVPFINDTDVDIAECWSPAPMTSLTTRELKEQLKSSITIWGGIAAQLFEPMYTDKQFDEYVRTLLREVSPGYHFVVGMGENLSPTGRIERVRRANELIGEVGPVPFKSNL